jgi:hypothetical protein
MRLSPLLVLLPLTPSIAVSIDSEADSNGIINHDSNIRRQRRAKGEVFNGDDKSIFSSGHSEPQEVPPRPKQDEDGDEKDIVALLSSSAKLAEQEIAVQRTTQQANSSRPLSLAYFMPITSEDDVLDHPLYQRAEREAISSYRRHLQPKGGPGPKGAPTSKAGSSGALTKCELIPTFLYKSDIEHHRLDNPSGYSFAVKVYDKVKGTVLGMWYEEITYTDSKKKNGIGTVSVTFNRNAALSFSAVVGQNQLPLTGGSGKFANCPGGFAQLVHNRIDKFYFNILTCATCG